MVAIVIPEKKIYTGKTDHEQAAEDFKREIISMMKKVAHEHNCSVEDLKYTVNNLGVVNIRSLTDQEIYERDCKNGR